VYDYVIVGAGTAGCVLAARLSEDPDARVALLEAGGPDTRREIAMPIAFPMLLKSSVDWDLYGEPEPGLGGRRLFLPRGKVIGGSGSINAMIYVRGNRADYDEWAAGGAEGWSYEEVLPYFRRSEDNERGEDAFHGVGGPLAVSDSRAMSPLIETMIEASVLAGHEHNPDFNGARQEGVGRFQLTQRDGLRCSTAAAFLHPAEGRPNLDVVTDAMALRILFDGSRAVGVEVARGGTVEQIRAEREVILSAGAYQSPVLLMISGIGPADDLELFGIEVRESLPVGHNLQDHLMAQLNYETDEASLFGSFTPENVALLEREGRGPLTSNIPEAGAFFRTRPDLHAPDIEFHYAPSMFYDEGLTAPHDSGYCFGPVLIKPASRGRVMLRAPLPDSKPRVLCNFLATEDDRASMIAGVRLALDIAEQEPLRKAMRRPFSVPAGDSDAEIMDWIRRAGQTVYHPTSTCAIGSVVDPQLRVYGVEGLRVVDASVMPTITRANTNAATIMIAEKAADLIGERLPETARASAA
jgi:choline dehydrogenase-like flavoprotein